MKDPLPWFYYYFFWLVEPVSPNLTLTPDYRLDSNWKSTDPCSIHLELLVKSIVHHLAGHTFTIALNAVINPFRGILHNLFTARVWSRSSASGGGKSDHDYRTDDTRTNGHWWSRLMSVTSLFTSLLGIYKMTG